MKICLVKTSSMGDVIHSLPAITDAQKAIVNLQVDWVVEENFAEIPSWHSAVKQVIPIALRRWRKHPLSLETRRQWQSYRKSLQQHQYEAVIDAQGLLKSGLFATRLIKGQKHGYDRHSIREPLASFFYHKKYAISYQQHAIERIRQLFAQALGYNLPTSPADYGIAQYFKGQAHNSDYLLFLHSTSRPQKHWLETEWKKLIQKSGAMGLQIYLPWGNHAEYQRAKRLSEGNSNVMILPHLTLSELAQYIVNAKGVVSLDTGLAHLAAALDKPNISLYGATDPKLIGCYGNNQYHIQANSMQAITAEQVFQSMVRII